MNDGTLDAVETEASGRVCIHFLDVSFLGNTMVRLILLTLMAPDAAIVCWKPLRGSVCAVWLVLALATTGIRARVAKLERYECD